MKPCLAVPSFYLIGLACLACVKETPCTPYHPKHQLDQKEIALFPYANKDTLNALYVTNGDTQQIQFAKASKEQGYHDGPLEQICNEPISSKHEYIRFRYDMPAKHQRILEVELSKRGQANCSTQEIRLSLQRSLWKSPIRTKIPYKLLLQDTVDSSLHYKLFKEVRFLGKTYHDVLRVIWGDATLCHDNSPWIELHYSTKAGFIRIEDFAREEVYLFY